MSDHAGKQLSAPGSTTATTTRAAPLAPGKQTLVQQVQVHPAPAARDATDAAVHASADRGVSTAAAPLPYADQIQRAFGRHDVSAIQAHAGPDASASARAMGADAYATGNHVVLGDRSDLHTVAHEAAHVVQQRGGVQLKGGVGQTGDPYEQHADQVADRVVRGESAEALLDQRAGAASGGGGPAIQRVIRDAQTQAPVAADFSAMTATQASAMLAEIEAGHLVADDDELAQLRALAGGGAPSRKRKAEDPGSLATIDDRATKLLHEDASSSSTPAPASSNTSSSPPDRPRGTRDVFETPAQYVTRTGTHLLYRAVRMTTSPKTKFGGTGIQAEGNEGIDARPDGNLFPELAYRGREARYRQLTAWPADAPIDAVDPTAEADPLVQVSGGNRGTQYISTGATLRGAAHNTVRSWNATGLPDERPIRNPKQWAPVITIDVRQLAPETRLYDIQHPGVNYMYVQDALGMMENMSAADAEVLIAGTIPAAAVVGIVTAPAQLAEAAGVTVEELKRRVPDQVLLEYNLIQPEAEPEAESDDEPYVSVAERRRQASQASGSKRRPGGLGF